MATIFFALVSAVAFGVADFLGGMSARKAHVLRVMPYIVFSGLIMLLLMWPLFGAEFNLEVFKAATIAGTLGSAGYAMVMYSLALGPMGVVAPITAVVASIVPFFIGLARGETLSTTALIGAVAALISIILVSRTTADHSHPATPKAVIAATVAGLTVAGYLVGISNAPKDSGIGAVIIARAMTFLILAFGALLVRSTFGSEKPDYKTATASGALDVWGGACFITATQHGTLVLSTVIVALYPALTVLLARIVLKERLERMQLVGLAGAGLAVTLLTLG